VGGYTIQFTNLEEISKEVSKKLSELYSCQAELDLDLKDLNKGETKLLQDAFDHGVELATNDDNMETAANLWKNAGFPKAEEGGSIAQMVAEEAQRIANRYILSKMRSPGKEAEVKKLMDRIEVENARTLRDAQ
jgi:hypothetical protein